MLQEQIRLHEAVDTALAADDPGRAEDLLQTALAEPAPTELAPEVVATVRQDQLYRLAEVLLVADEPKRALAATGRGLALNRRPTLFTANLELARGKALEVLDRGPEAAGAYHRALRINDRMLQEVINDD